MRLFPVPMEPDAEEKLMGGILSLRQFTYLLLGILSGGSVFFIGMPVPLKIILCVLLIIISGMFAFLRLYEMSLDKYLIRYLQYKKRVKKFYLAGDE